MREGRKLTKPKSVSNLLRKVNSEIEKYGKKFLVGLVDIDDTTYEELMTYTKYVIEEYPGIHRDTISIAMIYFAIREYDTDFWKEFSEKMNLKESEVTKIGRDAIKIFCKRNNLYFHYGKKTRGFVTSVLIQSIIPSKNMGRFLHLMNDIYFNDLDEYYSQDLVDELFLYMKEMFSMHLEEDDINIDFRGSKMTLLNQELPKAFRIAFVKSYELIKPIVNKILYYINKANFGETLDFKLESRFDYMLNEYLTDRNIDFSRKASDSSGSTKRQGRRFNKETYQFENYSLYLVIPRQPVRIRYIEKNEEIFFELYDGDILLHKEPLVILRRRLMFQSEEIKVATEFYPKLSYRFVTENGEVIFTRQVSRHYIILDNKGYEVKPNTVSYGIYNIITHKNSEIHESNDTNILQLENYKVATVNVTDDSLLTIGDKVLLFNTAKFREGICQKNKLEDIYVQDQKGFFYSIYNGYLSIRLRIPYESKPSNYFIIIDSKNFTLDKITEYEIKKIMDGSGDKLLTIRMDQSTIGDKPVCISIRERGSRKLLLNERVFIVNSFKLKFNKQFFYKESEATLIDLSCPDIDLGNITLPITVDLKTGNNSIKLEFKCSNSEKYNIVIKVPVIEWRLGNVFSSHKQSNYIWHEDIKGEKYLYIKLPSRFESDLSVYDKWYIPYDVPGRKQGHEYRFYIEKLFYSGVSGSVELKLTLLGTNIPITEIHFTPCVKDLVVSYQDMTEVGVSNRLDARWSFIGRGKVYVEINPEVSSGTIKEYIVEKNEISDQDIKLSSGKYKICFYQMVEDSFGKKEKIEIDSKEFVVGDPVIYYTNGRILQCVQCICGNFTYEFPNFYLSNIRAYKEKGSYEAEGFYAIRDKHKKRQIFYTAKNSMKFHDVVLLDKNKIRANVVDKEGDGLILDTKKWRICTDETNSYIYHRYKLIDYIVFEITSDWDERQRWR